MSSRNIKITGRSGCILTVNEAEGRNFIKKTSPSTAYNKRLLNQIRKQSEFMGNPVLPEYFSTPAIHHISDHRAADFLWFDMEYINGRSYSEYLEEMSVYEIDDFTDKLFRFSNELLKQCEIVEISKEIIRTKLNEINRSLTHELQADLFHQDIVALRQLIDKANKIELPVGRCHGDLTFSNMIFANGKIYLIDFLDSFIESPLIDIVKIRQDTKYYWSLMIENRTPSATSLKLTQILAYLDRNLDFEFGSFPFYREWYNFFERLNLLRIVPYLKNTEELNFIKNCLVKSE